MWNKSKEIYLDEQMRQESEHYRLTRLQEASTLEYMEVDTKPISAVMLDALKVCGWKYDSSEPYAMVFKRSGETLKIDVLKGLELGAIKFPIIMPDEDLCMILHLFKIIDLKTIKYACRGNRDNGNNSGNWMGSFISNQLNQE